MDFDTELAVLKALANPNRLKILSWMADPTRNFPRQENGDLETDGVCVAFITKKVGLSQPTVSTHMKTLEEAGLVSSKQIKNWVYYRLDTEKVAKALKAVENRLLKQAPRDTAPG